MRKLNVLILAYDFPPLISVGGMRPYNWMKYFNEYEIYPIIVTRQWSEDSNLTNVIKYVTESELKNTKISIETNYTLIEAPFKSNFANLLLLKFGKKRFSKIRTFYSATIEYLQFFFPIGNKRSMLKAADEFIESEKVDYIIATGDPFVLFQYAEILSKKHQIPWLADYRDPWSQDIGLIDKQLLKRIYSKIEKSIVKDASIITVANDYFKSLLVNKFPLKNVQIIANGFKDFNEIGEQKIQTAKFLTISFIGTIYKWLPFESFLDSLREFMLEQNQPIYLKLYGINNPDSVDELIQTKYKELKDNILIQPKIDNTKLLIELSKDNVMLLFNNYTITGTKIYDYLMVKRKILFCFTADEEAEKLKEKYLEIDKDLEKVFNPQIEIIESTKSGVILKNKNELKEELKKLLEEFNVKGFISCESKDIEKYSRENQLAKLAHLIKKNENNENK